MSIGPVSVPQLSAKWVAGFLFIVVSVGLEYVPAFAGWWDEVQDEVKKMAVAGFGLLVTVALIGLHYAGAVDLGLGPFDWPVAGQAFNVWLALLGGDWAIWSLLRRTFPRKRRAAP